MKPIYEPNEGIELLYTRDCQAWPQALTNLQAALAKTNIAEEPQLIIIDTLEQAEIYHFFASPTIHLGGVDIDPQARRVTKIGLGIGRPYFINGKSYAAPTIELIITALRELYLGINVTTKL